MGLTQPKDNDLLLKFYTQESRMNIKDVIANVTLIGTSAALLWHFSNIWRYGQHLIQEPNIIILSLETAGLLVILVFGVSKLISDFKGKRSGNES